MEIYSGLWPKSILMSKSELSQVNLVSAKSREMLAKIIPITIRKILSGISF